MMSCSEISFIWSAALFVLSHSSSPAAVEARRGHLGRIENLLELRFAHRQLLAGNVADGPAGGGSDLRELGRFVVPHDRGQGGGQHQSAFHMSRARAGSGQARVAYVRSTPEVKTTASTAAWAWKWLSVSRTVTPASAERRAHARAANSGCAFRPVPTAVPPKGASVSSCCA